jgi:hypothetical protein
VKAFQQNHFIKDAINSVITGIQSKVIVNITESERKSLSKVGPGREPYVNKSITDYGANIPAFNPIAWPLADAEKDGATYSQMNEVLTLLNEANDVVQELQMVAGHFAYQFMLGQYNLAQDNLETNISGAQTIVDGLKGAFEGQGNFAGPEPTTP